MQPGKPSSMDFSIVDTFLYRINPDEDLTFQQTVMYSISSLYTILKVKKIIAVSLYAL